ncbi:TetR/AcrR family transcriptional regulator [Mycobacterium sp. ACS4331]|uniref:TetR/AcrR family transcriptional regulator n=1 Tax=Mycobacterium sp. ACS4331 TaxID=1834121 RepID=UPI0007FF0EC1|nr:TetR/AcrR family transcriptional regulator [Mycobacterium sp. ACS4331]OBF20643.1 transcriptional regulator [Mycobacterium sp. ACS4331]
MTDQRTYGGRSAQQRRLDRRARLIGAALEAMAGNDWRTVTVDKLCAAAGLNKRYFYENFTDLDSLAAAVVDDIADEVRTAALTAAAETAAESLERQAEAAVGAVVRTVVSDPRRARVIFGAVPSSAALHQHRVSVMRGLTRVLVSRARAVHGVALEKDPLAQLAPAFIVGGTADAILAFVDGRAQVSLDELIATLTTLWMLTGDGAAEVARTRLGH